MPKHAANEPFDAASDSASNAGARRAADAKASDERIGLTEAFAPVDVADGAAFREARAAGDEHIGLTEAFAPVGEGAHAGGFSYRGDTEDDYPDALESLEPLARPPLLADDDAFGRDAGREQAAGRHGKEDVPAYQHKSRRMRRILIGVIIVLLVLLVAAAVATVLLVRTASDTAVQMAAQGSSSAASLQEGVEDASSGTEKLVTAPDLASLLGMGQDDALAAVGGGATVTSTREVNEEGNPIKQSLTVALADEPADSRSGTPTVYLGLGEDGKVVQAGYSAPTASLGYGSLSFADAVGNDHVVEKTLQEAGIPVEMGAAALPEDKAEYSTYDSTGKKLVRENCSFEGKVTIDGAERTWSATLSYDYTTANASNNLADTIRLIYVYVNA